MKAMDNLVIKTKLFPPASRTGVIMRSSLNNALDTIHKKKLAWVHAPAGYGKTTLLYQWYKSMLGNTQTVCWLSLDELDDEPVTFVRYVLCALQEVVDDF